MNFMQTQEYTNERLNELEMEIERCKELNGLYHEMNQMDFEKLFVNKAQMMKIFHVTRPRMEEIMRLPDFPLIKLGKEPMASILALEEWVRTRRVYSEMVRK